MKKSKRSRTARGMMAVAAPPNEQESVSIRKISNGFLISKSGTRRGKYFSHEEFSAGRPVVVASASKAPAAPAKVARLRTAPAAAREVGFLRR